MPSHRILRLAAGWLLVAAGAVIAPTPVPVGLVMVIVGLCLVARDSKAIRGAIRGLRGRHPAASDRVDRIKHRLPALLRHTLERTDPRRRPRFRRRRAPGPGGPV